MKRDSHPQSAARPGRGLLLCSAGLNLLLIVAVVGLAKNHLSNPPLPPTLTIVTSEARRIQPVEPCDSIEVTTNQLPFRWPQLESADFRAYIANLRAVHCPERIICDLVFHDLERVYEDREAMLPNPDRFWQPSQVREMARDQSEQRRRQMEQEKRAVMGELLGVWWSQEAWHFWYEEGWADIAETLVGYLKNAQVLEAVTVYHDMEEASRNLSDECELCSETDERARQEAAYQRAANAFAEIMSPAEFEEMALRICVVEGNFENYCRAEFRFRNGEEVRSFAKLVNRFRPFFSKEFLRHQDEDEMREALFQAEVRALFGEDRHAVWQRSQNVGYQEIWQFGQEQHLTQDTVLQAWQVREAAEHELSGLSNRTDLSPAERAAAWVEVRQQTELALASLLGARSGAQYLNQHGGWLKAPPRVLGGNP